MSIFSKIFSNRIKQEANKLSQTANSSSNAGWVSLFGNSTESEITQYRSFAYACINVRAELIMSGDILLFKKQLTKNKEITDHPFLDLISRNNIYDQSFPDILFLISSSMDLNGNSYVLAYRNDNNPFKMPEGLIVFPANSITPVLNSARTMIEYYRYSGGGQIVNYLPEQIIHFKIPNPDNIFIGKSITSALKIPLEIDYYQSQYQKSFYENFAAIGQILSSENKLTADQIDGLKSQFEGKYSGSGKAGKTLVLEGGIKASPSSATPREADYKDSRLANRDEVMSIFRVPKVMLGITDDVNRANAEATTRSFMFLTIIPFAKFIQSKLESFVKRSYDERLILKLDYPIESDRLLTLKFYEIMSKYGLLTGNEIREMENYEASSDPEMGKHIIPNNKPVDVQPQPDAQNQNAGN